MSDRQTKKDGRGFVKITLRKKDSVISSVLFVFNIYKEYKGECAIKLADLLEMMKCFDKSEASIRTGLSRMTGSGILQNHREAGEVIYELTEDGLQNLALWNKGLSRFFTRYAMRQQGWDGMWRFLTISQFNKSDYENQDIVDDLLECGIREVNGSIWVSPYTIDKGLLELLDDKSFGYITFEGRMQPKTGLSELLNSVYNLDALRQSYAAFLRSAEETTKSIEILRGGALFPLLFETGWSFYDIVTSDPALPKELLPHWEGDEAAAQMRIIRPQIISEVFTYFKEHNM